MLGAPRAASASPSEQQLPGRRAWDKRQRLLRAPEFAALSYPQAPWRASRRWIAMSAQMLPPNSGISPLPAPPSDVRFGFTVSRRQARRAVARNTVKRVLREAARHGAAQLAAAAHSHRVDILLRLQAPLPDVTAASWMTVKAELRREAESLIEQLRRRLLSQSLAQSAVGAQEPSANSARAPR